MLLVEGTKKFVAECLLLTLWPGVQGVGQVDDHGGDLENQELS